MHIFISYNWSCQPNALELEKELSLRDGQKQEVKTIIDVKKLKPYDRIPDFMENITTADFATVLICKDYLKAKNCIKEVLKLYKDDKFQRKFLPIVIKGTDVFSNENMIKHIEFWDKQYVETFKMAAEVKYDVEDPIWKEVQFYKDASTIIGKIIYYLRECLHLSLIKYEVNSERTEEEIKALNKMELEKLFEHLQI